MRSPLLVKAGTSALVDESPQGASETLSVVSNPPKMFLDSEKPAYEWEGTEIDRGIASDTSAATGSQARPLCKRLAPALRETQTEGL